MFLKKIEDWEIFVEYNLKWYFFKVFLLLYCIYYICMLYVNVIYILLVYVCVYKKFNYDNLVSWIFWVGIFLSII